MKKIFILIITAPGLFGCGRQDNNNDQLGRKQSTTDTVPEANLLQAQNALPAGKLFKVSHAEKILGEEVHLTDSLSTIKGDTLEHKLTYTANSKNQKTGKTGVVYFLFEQYAGDSLARKVYSSIKTANQNHEGFKILHGMGDEAYFHSDGQNFYFIMVRKGEKMFRIKVNKITSTTSLDDFNLVAKNITGTL